MSKFIRSAALTTLLVGVALVIQGCGGASASKTCSDGKEVKVSCSGDTLAVTASAAMGKDDCDKAKQAVDEKLAQHRQPGITADVSCSGGKFSFSMKVKTPGQTSCTQEMLNNAVENACNQAHPGATSMVAFAATQAKSETQDDSINTARSIIASTQNVANILSGASPDEKTTVQSLVATDAKTETFGAPDKLSKSIVAETQEVVNDVQVAMQSNSETSDPELLEKLLWMALGGLVVGATFLAYHIKIVKRLQAREMSGKSVQSPSLEMAPPPCTA